MTATVNLTAEEIAEIQSLTKEIVLPALRRQDESGSDSALTRIGRFPTPRALAGATSRPRAVPVWL